MNQMWGIFIALFAYAIASAQTPVDKSEARADRTTIEFPTTAGQHYIVEEGQTLDGFWVSQPSSVATGSVMRLSIPNRTPEAGFLRVRDLSWELEQIRARWEQSGITNYVLWSTRRADNNDPVQGERLRVSVEDKTVASAMIPFPQNGNNYYPSTNELTSVFTIDQWFDVIETSLLDSTATIELRWDSTTSYPSRFRYAPGSLGGVAAFDMDITVIDTEHKLLALDLASARERWTATGATNYVASMRQDCFCFWPEEGSDVTFDVRDETVDNARYRASGNPVGEEYVPQLTDTVEGIFNQIESLMRADTQLNVTFAPNGVPTQVFATPLVEYFAAAPHPPIIQVTEDADLRITYSVRVQ